MSDHARSNPPMLYFGFIVYNSGMPTTQEMVHASISLAGCPWKWSLSGGHFPHLSELRSTLHLLAAEVSRGKKTIEAESALDSIIHELTHHLPASESECLSLFLQGRPSQTLTKYGPFHVGIRGSGLLLDDMPSFGDATLLTQLMAIRSIRSSSRFLRRIKTLRYQRDLALMYHCVNAAIEIIAPLGKMIGNHEQAIRRSAKSLTVDLNDRLMCQRHLLYQGYKDFILYYSLVVQ